MPDHDIDIQEIPLKDRIRDIKAAMFDAMVQRDAYNQQIQEVLQKSGQQLEQLLAEEQQQKQDGG